MNKLLKDYVLVTNNKKVYDTYSNEFEVEYIEGMDYSAVLNRCRELIHSGYIMETHPLSGSIKPNETPFKTVLLSAPSSDNIITDTQSLLIIEDAVATYEKFLLNRPTPNWIGRAVDDFMTIDLSLIKPVMEKLF